MAVFGWGSRGAPALALIAALVVAAPAQARLARGDLLVTDFNNAVVWRVRPNGQVSAFSARTGSGPNRLVHPAGIAVHPSGQVFVADNATGELVEIDPDTGAQRAISTFFYDSATTSYVPGTLGAGPYGLDIDLLGVVLVTASDSDQMFEGTIANGLGFFKDASFGSLGPSGPYGVAALRLGTSDFIAVANGANGWLDAINASADLFPSAHPNGVVWDTAIGFGLIKIVFFVEQVPGGGVFGCDPSSSGVHVYMFTRIPLSLGGLLRCPFALAFSLGLPDLFVADAASMVGGDARVVRIDLNEVVGAQSLVAELPEGDLPTLPAGIALVVPEPGAAAAPLAALLALAIHAKRLRRSTRPR